MALGITLYFSVPSLCESLVFTLFYYETSSAVCPSDNEGYLYISSRRKVYKIARAQKRPTEIVRCFGYLKGASLSSEVHSDGPRGEGYKLQHEKFWLDLRTNFQSSQRSCGLSVHVDIQSLTRQRPEQPTLTLGWDPTSHGI